MSKVSSVPSATARNNESRILQALNLSNQSKIAEQLNVDPSTITRLKNNIKINDLTEIQFFCELLNCLGLKVVPKEYQSIDKSRVEALLVLSKSWMSRIETVDDLFHDEISERADSLGYGQ